jgi:hypothetical protein
MSFQFDHARVEVVQALFRRGDGYCVQRRNCDTGTFALAETLQPSHNSPPVAANRQVSEIKKTSSRRAKILAGDFRLWTFNFGPRVEPALRDALTGKEPDL